MTDTIAPGVAVGPQIPVGHSFADLGRRQSLVLPVVPLNQVVADFRDLAEPRKLTRLPRAPQLARVERSQFERRGLACECAGLLAPARVRLFPWFPVLLLGVVATVAYFKLEVTVPSSGDIFFSSGTPQKQVLVETTLGFEDTDGAAVHIAAVAGR